jgi:small subunit ribosomal protein S16
VLVIRLQRTGKRNAPAFKIVVTEHSAPIKGRAKEYMGHYLPTRNPHELVFNKERIAYWMSVGAKPSNTVARLLKNAGMDGMDKFIESYTKKRKRKESPEEAAPAAPAATEAPAKEKTPVEEAPKEEPKTEEEKPKEEAAPAEEQSPPDDTEPKES